jgi:hypothetical protein
VPAQAEEQLAYTITVGQEVFGHVTDQLKEQNANVRTAWDFIEERGYHPTWQGSLRLQAAPNGSPVDLVVVPFVEAEGSESEFVGLFHATQRNAGSRNSEATWVAIVGNLAEGPKVTNEYIVWRSKVLSVNGSVKTWIATIAECAAAAGLCRLAGPAWLACVLVACVPSIISTAVASIPEELAKLPECYVAVDHLNLREKPGTGSRVIALLYKGTPLEILETGVWVRVRLEQKIEGYVFGEYLSFSPPGPQRGH